MLLLLACVAPDPADTDRSARTPAVEGVPGLAVEPYALEYGTVRIGDSVEHTLTLTSVGTASVTVDVTLDDPWGGFSTTEGALTIEPGDAVELPVTFAPTDVDVVGARVLLDSDEPDAAVLGIPLTADASVWRLEADPRALELGDMVEGCTATGSLRIGAFGGDSGTITALVFDDPAFEATAALPATLAPDEGIDVGVSFAAEGVGDWTGVLTAVTDIGDIELAEVHMTLHEAVEVTLTYVVPEPTQQDVLVLVDDVALADPSLGAADRVATLVEALATDDRRMAVVVADDGCVPGGWIDAATADPQGALDAMLAEEPSTRGGLELLESATSATATGAGGCNEGLLRGDAAVVVVGVAASDRGNAESWSHYVSLLEDLAPDGDLAVHVAAPDYPSGCGGYTPSYDWYAASLATDGAYTSLCGSDWAEQLAAVVPAEPWPGDIELTAWPVDGTLVVTLDGTKSSAWEYNETDNSVDFDEPDDIPPGTVITVTFTQHEECTWREKDHKQH